MAEIKEERAPRGRARGVGGTRRAAEILARIIDVLVAVIAVIIVAGILFVVLGANRDNTIVKDVHDAAKFLVGPFDGMFTPDDHKAEIAINWGIALAVYVVVGRAIASLLRRHAD